MSFEIVYTDKGLEKLVLAENGTPLVLEKFAVGDGENAPETSQIALQNEKWRGYINKVEVSSTTPTNLLVTCVIPAQIPITEAFYIRELGLFDTEEELIAIAKVPDSYYAQSSNGIASEKLYNIVLSISNTAEVTLELDTTILATQESVKELDTKVEELTDQFQTALTQLNNKFTKSLKNQIGKIIINMDPQYKDMGIWDDGIFKYVLCNGQAINPDSYSDLAAIYGTNVPNFKDGTVRNLIKGNSRALGSWEEDALQKITGWVDGIDIATWRMSSSSSGSLYWGTDGTMITGAENAADQSTPRLHFDASKVARTADETRMKNIAVQFYVIGKVLI
ncbi:Phage tail fiber protein [Candidatus Hepatincola sp. Pdp]